MPKKTNLGEETNFQNQSDESLQNALRENSVLKDLINLKDDAYFRQQLLIQVERIATAMERQAKALEESLGNSDEKIEN